MAFYLLAPANTTGMLAICTVLLGIYKLDKQLTNDVRSAGMAYGMMIAVQLAHPVKRSHRITGAEVFPENARRW